MRSKIYFIIILQVLVAYQSKAQYDFLPDQTTGRPLTVSRYENVSGTPYLVDKWSNGEVRLANGSLVKPKAIKFDVVTNKLLFQQEDKVFEFFPRVAAFTLLLPDGKRTFLLKDSGKDGYFELLVDGNIQLLKKITKTVLERKGYNSAVMEKVIDENISYAIIEGGKQKEIKLTKKSLSAALPNHKTEIMSYSFNSDNLEKSFIDFVSSLNVK